MVVAPTFVVPGTSDAREGVGRVFVTNYHDGTVSVLDESRL
jgi:hypothetical protein